LNNVFRGARGAHPARNRSIVRSWLTLRRVRRLSQGLFLGLFLALLWMTEYRGSFSGSEAGNRLPYPVRIFLETDPFIAVTNALATHALYRGLLWSLAILIPTFFLGRFFCGWICPLGTLHHAASSIRTEKKSGKQRIAGNRYKKWQSFKYVLLAALVAMAFWGSAIAGMFDPIALAVRSVALSAMPAWTYAVGHSGPAAMLLSSRQAYFRQGFLLGVILIALLALNLRITRFWCRALCPLGALLGVASRWSVLGLEKRPDHCGDCNRCLLNCQGGDDPIPGAAWRKAECHLCMNCVADCPESGIAFRFFSRSRTSVERVDIKRRKVLAGLAAGTAALPLLRANTGLGAEAHERRIRPPGALDEKPFLARCIRCGECMKVCPGNALHPAFSEAGWEGIWTPVLAPRVGYCEPSCTLCGEVCPTGAIWNFTAREKGWVTGGTERPPIRLGTAFYDRGRCLPWAMGTECIVCEEWCPTSPKAVYLRAAEVTDAAGSVRQVRQPYINPERCVGCGACEFACPVRDRPAVYVTSVGESRSKTNQILLRRGKSVSWLPESGEAAGWTKAGETRAFDAVDLWKYVDGDAERYLRAGVERTLTSHYRYRDGVEAVADVHRMGSPEGARRMFESEPAAGSRPMALGDGGRSYGQSVTFRRGAYFVRLVAYEDAPQVEQALMSLGRTIEGNLERQ
jgi:polyferredoxin